ncbi:hypothetical protein SORBI_3009G030501 [Sorghum bicolor]|uniref:Uncharacterized protein n=1 Tax=Sorghum bicolor TaxID=4558 RepID=A0A1Z5R0M8_SORBI|nr:hypothetical protein SORBI_3009G030501 [Sorghum bicolor]
MCCISVAKTNGNGEIPRVEKKQQKGSCLIIIML